MNTRLFFFTTLSIIATSLSAGIKYSGQCIDESGHALSGVSITLNNVAIDDSGYSTISGNDGLFQIDDIEPSKYMIVISKEGYDVEKIESDIQESLSDQLIVLTRSAVELTDVVITAKKINTYSDRDEIYLAKNNADFGTSALDAISSLPQFKTTINGRTLKKDSGDEVTILINGRRSDASELLSLKGEDVAKVVFYERAPVKYRHIATGPMVDVYLSKKRNTEVTTSLRTSNGVVFPIGDNRIGITFSNENNYLSAEYNMDYLDMRHGEASHMYDYGDYVNLLNSENKTKNALNGIGKISYQYSNLNNTFFTSASYAHGKSKEYGMFHLSSLGNTGYQEEGFQRETSDSNYEDILSLDLYYSHRFNHGQELSFDIVNTYQKTSQNSLFYQFQPDPEVSEIIKDDFSTFIRNKSWSIIANAAFSTPLWIGKLDVAANFMYKNLYQNYINSHQNLLTRNNYNNERRQMYSISYGGKVEKLSFTVWASILSDDFHLQDISTSPQTSFLYNLFVHYPVSKNISFLLIGEASSGLLGIGAYTNDETYIDTHYISRDNPDLRHSNRYGVSFKPTFLSTDNRLFASAELIYTYDVDLIAPVISKEKDNAVLQLQNLPWQNTLLYRTTVSYSPWKWISFKAGYMGINYRYRLPEAKHTFRSDLFYGGIDVSVGKWQLAGSFRSPDRTPDGSMSIRNGWNVSGAITWKHKGLSVGVSYSYRGEDSDQGSAISFSTFNSQCWKDLRHEVRVDLSYTFNWGKSGQSINKRLNNKDFDNGLKKRM